MSIMRYLPGQPPNVSGESITSFSLIKNAAVNPDILPRVWQAVGQEESPLSAFMSDKGLVTKGLYDNMTSAKYRVVGSNHVMYQIKNADKVKVHMIKNSLGATYKSDAYPTEPGKNKTPFTIWLDSNWARPNDLIELNDNNTLLFVYDNMEPKEDSGGFKYNVLFCDAI